MRHLVTFCFALYFSSGFLQAQSSPPTLSSTQAIVTDTNCAIIPYQPDCYWIFKNVQATTLSEREIQVVDSIYTYCKNDHRDELIKHANYKRQYVPVINNKGEKEVWVNCFCDYESDWQKRIVIVFDGGKCFFNLKINITKKEYYDFGTNGEG